MVRVQLVSLADVDHHAGTPQHLDPLVHLYLFLAFLLRASLRSSDNSSNCQHWNPLPPLGVAALQGYPLHEQALLTSSLPLDRILGLRHQDPSVGLGQLAYEEIHSVASEGLQQVEVEASLLEVLIPH